VGARPLAGAALAFAAGLGLGAWLPQRPAVALAAAASVVAAWVVLLGAGRETAGTLAGVAAMAAAGAAWSQADLRSVYRAGAVPEGDAVLVGRLVEPARPRGDATVLRLGAARLRTGGRTFAAELPVEVFVRGRLAGIRIGELLRVRGRAAEVRADRNLGWFPRPARAVGDRVGLRVFCAGPAWARREGREGGRGPDAAVLRWREAASRFWAGAPPPASAILDALTTGERAAIPEATREAFLRSGLTHILAISGMNVAFLAALVYLGLRRLLACVEPLALRRPVQPLAAVATLPFLWFFCRFSGSQIPVGRAALTAAAAMVAVVLWRRVDPLDGCAVAGCAILATDPRALYSASFQLSFAAVAALALAAPRLAPAATGQEATGPVARLRRGARAILLASAAAGGATAPLVAFHFQQVNLVGPVANLVAVPLSGMLVLPAAWLALAAEAAWPALGELLRAVAVRLADVLVAVAGFFAAPSWASVGTPRPPPLLVLALLALVAALLLPRAGPARRRARLGAAAAVLAAAIAWRAGAAAAGLRAVFLDVGQGLAAAVLPPGGGVLLVDAGPRWGDDDAGRRIVAPALRRLGVARLDALALTHTHPDHAGGVASVLRELKVERVWVPAVTGEVGDAVLRDALARHRRGGGQLEALGRGAVRPVGEGATARVLWPPAAGGERRVRAGGENARSLVLLVAWDAGAVLVTGDAGPREADALRVTAAVWGPRVPLVLQAPHHGGSAEACAAFADAWRPRLSVVPVGRNSYGHPRPDALAALEAAGEVARTDRDGAVLVVETLRGLRARTWRGLAQGRSWPERLRWAAVGW